MHPDGRAYGIYNDSSKEIHFGLSLAVFDVKGAEATGIYAGNNREGVKKQHPSLWESFVQPGRQQDDRGRGGKERGSRRP